MPAVEADAFTLVADRLFAAIEHSDQAMLQQLWNDDIAVWRAGSGSDRDKERALRVLY